MWHSQHSDMEPYGAGGEKDWTQTNNAECRVVSQLSSNALHFGKAPPFCWAIQATLAMVHPYRNVEMIP